MNADQILLYTLESLRSDFERLGVNQGDTVLLHSCLESIGWVCGGAEAVIYAFLDNLGGTGTLVVPTFTFNNSNPTSWSPGVSRAWIQITGESVPPFNPQTTPSTRVGAIAELVRTWPGALRSDHPQASFAAVGQLLGWLMDMF